MIRGLRLAIPDWLVLVTRYLVPARAASRNVFVILVVEQSESDGKAAIYVAAFVLHNGDLPANACLEPRSGSGHIAQSVEWLDLPALRTWCR